MTLQTQNKVVNDTANRFLICVYGIHNQFVNLELICTTYPMKLGAVDAMLCNNEYVQQMVFFALIIKNLNLINIPFLIYVQ